MMFCFKMAFFPSFFFIVQMIFLIVLSSISYYYPLAASARIVPSNSGLAIHDPSLEAAVIYEGLDFPTNMAFLAPNDILVLEKENGKVQRIVNGNI
jgi:glucose/arabinose dehydrogenase